MKCQFWRSTRFFGFRFGERRYNRLGHTVFCVVYCAVDTLDWKMPNTCNYKPKYLKYVKKLRMMVLELTRRKTRLWPQEKASHFKNSIIYIFNLYKTKKNFINIYTGHHGPNGGITVSFNETVNKSKSSIINGTNYTLPQPTPSRDPFGHTWFSFSSVGKHLRGNKTDKRKVRRKRKKKTWTKWTKIL